MLKKRGSTSEQLVSYPGRPRNDLRTLLRSPWVQGVLVIAASAPVVATMAEAKTGKTVRSADQAANVSAPGIFTPEPVFTLPAVPASVEEAWRNHALRRQAEEVAAKYRAQGFRISEQLARDIGEAAQKHNIDPAVAFGLVRAESSFRNTATSPVGATGLTQLMPRTAAWIEPGTTHADLRDQRTNLEIGFKYLRYLIDKYDGNEDLALLAYNRGPGTVNRALRQGLNPDNGYAAFVRGEKNHGHRLFTNSSSTAKKSTARASTAKKSTAKPAAKKPAKSTPKRNTTTTARKR